MGRVIGGPLDGQMLTASGWVYFHPVANQHVIRGQWRGDACPSAPMRVPVQPYRWADIAGVGVWYPAEWELEHVMRRLTNQEKE